MLVVRCTARLLSRLKAKPDPAPLPSTTRLGDWYATLFPIRPLNLVLLVNEATRLPVVLRAREASTLNRRIPDAISNVLEALHVSSSTIASERLAMAEVAWAKTASRSVLGTMNEFALHLSLMLEADPHRSEFELSMELTDVLVTVRPLGYQVPGKLVQRVLSRRALV